MKNGENKTKNLSFLTFPIQWVLFGIPCMFILANVL